MSSITGPRGCGHFEKVLGFRAGRHRHGDRGRRMLLFEAREPGPWNDSGGSEPNHRSRATGPAIARACQRLRTAKLLRDQGTRHRRVRTRDRGPGLWHVARSRDMHQAPRDRSAYSHPPQRAAETGRRRARHPPTHRPAGERASQADRRRRVHAGQRAFRPACDGEDERSGHQTPIRSDRYPPVTGSERALLALHTACQPPAVSLRRQPERSRAQDPPGRGHRAAVRAFRGEAVPSGGRADRITLCWLVSLSLPLACVAVPRRVASGGAPTVTVFG